MHNKHEIIMVLQKLSKEMAGKTPSEKVFLESTNYSIYDRMRYWPNYGELVKEAGLSPNIFDKTKYSKDQLCDMFITLILEKHKWPTRGDLDVKHHMDTTFPASATFYKKLGLTSQLVSTIKEYVDGQEGFDYVKTLCKEKSIDYQTNQKPEHIFTLDTGYVYLGKQNGYFKIGKSRDTNRRREDISLLGAEPFLLIHEIKTDDMMGVEKYWHERFKEKRKRGEWFDLTASDVKAFKKWKIA